MQVPGRDEVRRGDRRRTEVGGPQALLDVLPDAVEQLFVGVAPRRVPSSAAKSVETRSSALWASRGPGACSSCSMWSHRWVRNGATIAPTPVFPPSRTAVSCPTRPAGQLDAVLREHHHEGAEIAVELDRVRALRVVHGQVAGAQQGLPAVLHQEAGTGQHEAHLEGGQAVVRRMLRRPLDDVLTPVQLAEVHVVDRHRTHDAAEGLRCGARQAQRQEDTRDHGPVGLEGRRHVCGEPAGHRLLPASSRSDLGVRVRTADASHPAGAFQG